MFAIHWKNQHRFRFIYGALFFFLLSNSLHAFIDNPYNVSFQVIRTPMLPMDDELPGENEGALRINVRWYNVWSIQQNRFVVDGEELQVAPTFRYQVGTGMQIGATIPAKAQGGGVLDGSIERFHAGVGVTQGLRDRYARNTMNVSYEPLGPYYALLEPGFDAWVKREQLNRTYPRSSLDPPISASEGSAFEDLDEVVPVAGYDRSGMDNPTVFLQNTWNFSRSYIDSMNTGVAIRIPVFSAVKLFRSAGTDYSLFSTIKKNFLSDRLHAELGVSYTRFEMTRFEVLTLPAQQWVVRPAVSYDLGSYTLLGEYLYFSRPVSNYGELSKPGHQVAFGLEKIMENYKLTVAILENFANYGVTPDVGFHFSVETLHL